VNNNNIEFELINLMENKINENNILKNEETEDNFISFISKIESKFNKKDDSLNDIKIIGRVLYYMSDVTIIYFNYKMPKNSKDNLFDKDIMFGFEFIENKVPYVRALNNFVNPTLYDGRNLYYCLTNKYNYVFDVNKLDECMQIIDMLIIGIKNFIISLKDNIDIKVFIYYGEYNINHVYLMNDFLMNSQILKFYRIYELINNNKNEELKYILITQLFFLIFEPISENKSLGKLIQINYIKDVKIMIENNSKNKIEQKNDYFFKINKDSNDTILIKFILAKGGFDGKKRSKDDNCDYNDYLELKKALDLSKINNCPIICSTIDRLTRDYSFGKRICENYNTIKFGVECKNYISQIKEKEYYFKNIKMHLYENKTEIQPENSQEKFPIFLIISKVLTEVKTRGITKDKQL
jgi:hypothetical protein